MRLPGLYVNKKSNKADLRKAIRNKRTALTLEQQSTAAQGLLIQLQTVPAFRAARKIAMYLINDGEIDPVDVMKWCWKNSMQTYVPLIVRGGNNILLFAEVNQHSEFNENQFGIREPAVEADQIIDAADLDLVLTPLVAFDQNGNRIGMGGGFYDATFAFVKNSFGKRGSEGGSLKKPEMIGIAHEMQKVDGICAEQWDIPLTTVVTDKNVYRAPLLIVGEKD